MFELIERGEERGRATADARGELSGLRILVVMPTIPLHGMERKTINTMKGLRERGADVLFITQKDYGQKIQREVERIGCRWAAASFDRLIGLPKSAGEAASMLRAWFRSAREFNRIRREYRPTHIHLTNFTFFLYTWPALLRAPEVVVFALPTPPDMSFSGYKRRLNNLIWRHGVEPVCDHIICNSKFTVNQLEAIKVSTEKVSIIHNTNTNRACQAGDAPDLNTSKYKIVYVGRICADKGVREFVEAASRIAAEREDVDFYLAGDYSWQNPFAEELIKSVELKGLASRVRFLGEIQDIEKLISQCHLHVCPSVCDEAFANVVLEAKSCGIPSVVFPSGGLPEMVSHLVDGYICESKSSPGLEMGIRYFLDRPEIMKASGHVAKCSMTRFSAERNAEAWASVYKAPKPGK